MGKRIANRGLARRESGFAAVLTLVLSIVAVVALSVGISLLARVPADAARPAESSTAARSAASSIWRQAGLPVQAQGTVVTGGSSAIAREGEQGEGAGNSPDPSEGSDSAASRDGEPSDGAPSDANSNAATAAASPSSQEAVDPAADPASASAGDPAAPAAVVLEKAIADDAGKHYTVRVEYAPGSGIPEGAELSVAWVMLTPEGYDPKKPEFKDRPTEEERFVSAAQLAERAAELAKALDVREGDETFYTAFLDISLKADGKAAKLAEGAKVKVTVETDAVKADDAKHLRASFFTEKKPGAEHAEALNVQDRSADPAKDKKYEKGAKVAFETDKLSELGLMGVITAEELEAARAEAESESASSPVDGASNNAELGAVTDNAAGAVTGDAPAEAPDPRLVLSLAAAGNAPIAGIVNQYGLAQIATAAGEQSNSCTVTWADDEGAILKTEIVAVGETPTALAEAPKKAATAQYTYAFAGWSNSRDGRVYIADFPEVTDDVEYIATYTATVNTYTVVWESDDGTVLETDYDVPYGTTPEYNGKEPTKTGYRFGLWSPEIEPVAGDVTYAAIFTQSPVEVLIRDHSTRKAVSGAHLTLTNGDGIVVWEGTTGDTGLLWIEQKDEERAGGQCAKFEPGSEYTLKQTNPDGAYITPKGSWTLKVGEDGSTFSLTVNADATDMSTWPASGPYGARFYIDNVGASTVTYESNYPADVEQEQFKETSALPELAYNYEYKVTRDDPSADGYAFVGWQVDGSSIYVHKDSVITLDTLSRPAHTMIAQWRIPLNVAAYTYAQGDSANAQLVADSDQEYKIPVERSLTFSGLAAVADAYGQQNVPVHELNVGTDYSFAYATLQQGADAAVRISALQYDAAVHAWQYKTAESDDWSNIGHDAQLNLYYTQDIVNVRWVQAQEDGTLVPLDTTQFPGSTVAVSYDWASTDDLIAASDKPVVQGSCYYRYLGFGDAGAGALADLGQSGLQSFSLKNSENGFLFSADGSGDGAPIEGDTIYVVYSEIPPEDSMSLSIQNHTGWSYEVSSLYVGGELAANDWLAQGNVVRVSVDDETSQVTLQVMNAKDTVDINGKADLVLLGAGAKAFVIDGGFVESADAGTVASVAVEGSSKVVRTTLTKVSASENGLANTKSATRGVLEEDPTTVVVAFDSDLSDLTVNKTWGTGAFPETHGYKVDFMLHEGDGLVSKQCVTDDANADGLYRVEKDPWSITVPNLPTRLVYSVSEEAVWEGSANVIGDFQPSYGEGEGDDDDARTVQVLNELTSDVCQVGDVKFLTVKAAVDYIESNVAPNEQGVKVATIEMLRDYIMAESGSVEIPEGCDITLTSADADNPNAITRGFASATDTFLVNGKLTIANVTLSGQLGKTDMAKDGNGGLVRVGEGATLTAGAGARLTHGRAVNGSAVYVESGAVVNLDGATVTDCRATTGGAIGVADATCRINVSGDTRVTNNKAGTDGYTSNIYLDLDSNEIIQVVGALGEGSLVGVYVPSPDQDQTLYNAHGAPAQPFATIAPGAGDAGELNLGKFSNDRLGSGLSKYGALSELLENTVVWGETFSFTVELQWLDDKLDLIDQSKVPDDATVTLRLDGGYVTTGGASKEITVRKDASGAWTGTFKGVAKYNGGGNPYEYTVAEPSLPADFKRIIFTGDYAVSDNKLTYSSATGNDQVVLVSNYYHYTEFTVQKKAENLPNGQTISSTFQVYRIAKDGMTNQNGVRYGGVGSVSDLPLALRSTGEFTTDGGNRWYVTTPDGAKMRFHKFYDIVFGEFTYDEAAGPAGIAWQAGDVVRVSDASGACLAYGEDGKWHDLDSTVKASYIEFSRQDGNGGVEGVGGSSADKSCTVTGVSNSESKSYTFEADSKQLSSDYYYYAVETTVAESGGQGRTISDSHQLVATYDPKYEYNQLTQTVTVTNTYRDYLSVDKRWADDATTLGECVFNVYKVKDASGATADYLNNASNFESLVKADIASMVAAGKIELVTTFKLPEPNGSWVHVLDDLDASQNVYFAWEESAGGVPISTPDTSAANVKADAVYSYVYPITAVNQITVKNMSDVLCKVVDDDGTENPFRTLNDAYTYGTTRDPSKGSNDEFTIYMLRDYSIPTSDVLTIAEGKKVTLATATTGPDYTYTPPASDATKKRATITRQSGNAWPFIRVAGNAADVSATSIVLEDIELNGANIGINYRVGNTSYYNGGFVYATNATVVLRESDANDAKATGVLMRDARASNGGAIYAASSNVDVRNAEFQNCVSTDTNNGDDRGGGAIWTSGATTTVLYSTFTGCTAIRRGGGIASVSQAAEPDGAEATTVQGCSFADCVAQWDGGGVYSRNYTLAVGGDGDDACAFTNCTGYYRGGGVFHGAREVEGSVTSVTNCTFTSCATTMGNSNYSDGKPHGGGGLCTYAYTMNLASCTFDSCESYTRGGGAFHFNFVAYESNLADCVFTSCVAATSGGNGGGGAGLTGITQHITNCTFSGCVVKSGVGGAIDIGYFNHDKDAYVTGCVFENCSSNRTSDNANGGGICFGGRSLIVVDSKFIKCAAIGPATANGGAISLSAGGSQDSLVVQNCTFEHCTARNAGGALYQSADYKTATAPADSISGSAFTDCETTYGSGGAVYTNAMTFDAEKTSFENCTGYGEGGAVRHDQNLDNTRTSLADCFFNVCRSVNSSGGALWTRATAVEISSTPFTSTTARYHGGAVFQEINQNNQIDASSIAIDECAFNTCTATGGNGGAVNTNAQAASITGAPDVRAFFKNCQASGHGGAVYHTRQTANSSMTIDACSFESCDASANTRNDNYGGAVFTAGTLLAVSDANFSNCSTRGLGGAVCQRLDGTANVPYSGASFTNCNFDDCQTINSSGGAFYTNALELTVTGEYGKEAEEDDAVPTFHTCIAGNGHGGAIYHDRGSYVESKTALELCDFSECVATRIDSNTDARGGAVCTWATGVAIEDVSFSDCTAKGFGGALCTQPSTGTASIAEISSVSVARSSFAGCSSEAQNGGSVYTSATVLELTDSSFDESTALWTGGAVYQGLGNNNQIDYSKMTAAGTTFYDCSTGQYSGGAVYTSALTVSVTGQPGVDTFRNCAAQTEGGALRHDRDRAAAATKLVECHFNACESRNADGGGLWTKATTLDIDDSSFADCVARGVGGAIRHRITDNNQVATSATSIHNTKFADCTASTDAGGALYDEVKTTLIDKGSSFVNCKSAQGGGAIRQTRNSDGTTVTVKDCEFAGCETNNTNNKAARGGAMHIQARTLTIGHSTIADAVARNDGGAIYHNPESAGTIALTIDDKSAIENCTSLMGNGGGVYTQRSTVNLTEVTISGCSAINGGGLYQPNTDSRAVTLDGCIFAGNSATIQGGAVYFYSNNALTLRNGTSITNNSIANTIVENSAGIYIHQSSGNNAALVLGSEDADSDTITVYDNYTSADAQSNVRLITIGTSKQVGGVSRNYNRADSVSLLSNLVKPGVGVTGTIGVVNPGPENTQFGVGNVGERTGMEYIVSDIDAQYGKLDPGDVTERKRIIWYAPPVCKITDPIGDVLYYGEGTENTAAFSSLKDAIDILNVLEAGYLHTYDGVVPDQLQVQMLVPEYTLNDTLPALKREVTLTTARRGTGDYDYPMYATSPTATITRGPKAAAGSLFTVGAGLTFSVRSLTIDGGNRDAAPLVIAANGGLVYAQPNARVVLSENAVLRNSAVAEGNNGGAVYITGGTNPDVPAFTMDGDATIVDCSAGNGGGVYLTGGVLFNMKDAPRIENCSASEAGGAVYVSPYATLAFVETPSPIISGNTITQATGAGAGIYLPNNDSKLYLQLGTKAVFADNNVLGTDDDARQNGFEAYPQLRQDIYLGESAEPVTSIVLTGDLAMEKGDVWVWADSAAHYKTEMQFAVVASDADGSPAFTPRDSALALLHNARDDSDTENDTDTYLYGLTEDGVNVIWSYNTGSAKVILRKVADAGGSYDSLSGAVFTVYKGRSSRPYVVRHDDGTRETLSGLRSGEAGVFWIGNLPYGMYYLEETTTPSGYDASRKWFRLDIDETGVRMSSAATSRAAL